MEGNTRQDGETITASATKEREGDALSQQPNDYEAGEKTIEELDEKVSAFNDSLKDDDTALREMFEESLVNPSDEVRPDEFIFEWDGVGFMPKENIVMLKAPAKSGKPFALTLFAVAYIKGAHQGLRRIGSGGKVLFVDTEQAKNDTLKLLKRIERESDSLDALTVLNARC